MVVVVVVGVSGCWSGWQTLLDTTPSKEHRIEDLRVIAIRAEPASFYVDADGSVPDVVVTPFVYDPRGGAVALQIGLCAPASFSQPCVDVPIEVRSVVLAADEHHPLGRVTDTTATLSLTPRLLSTLLSSSSSSLSVVPVPITIVVDVTKPGTDPVERERATLTLPLRLDPRTVNSVSEDTAVRLCADPADPGENAVCFGGSPPGPCGDGVVDANESCDPPDGDRCGDDCLRHDACAPATRGSAPCLERLPPNEPPLITGFDLNPSARTFDVATSDQDVADVDVGAVAEVEPQPSLRIAPVVDVAGAFDEVQEFFAAPLEPWCESQPVAACLSREAPSLRFYVPDGPFDLVAAEPNQPVNQSGNAQAELAIPRAARRGDEVVVVVVASDGRGGLDVAELTLRLR